MRVQFFPNVIAYTIVGLPTLPLRVGLHAQDTSQQLRDLPHGMPLSSSPQAAELGFFSLSLTKITERQNHCFSDTTIKIVMKYYTLPM